MKNRGGSKEPPLFFLTYQRMHNPKELFRIKIFHVSPDIIFGENLHLVNSMNKDESLSSYIYKVPEKEIGSSGGIIMKKDKKESVGVKKRVAKLGQQIKDEIKRVTSKVVLIVCLEFTIVAMVLAYKYDTENMKKEAISVSACVEQKMAEKMKMVETMAGAIDSGSVSGHDAILEYVDTMVAKDDLVSAVYSCYDENVTVMSGGWEPPEDFVVTEREWYKGTVQNPDKVYVSEPYVDEQSGQLCITLAKRTFKNGNPIGVVGMDMYLDGLVGLIEETYDGNDYGFLVSANDTILVHPNKEYSLDHTVSKLLKDVNRGAYESVVEDDLKTSIKLDYKGGFKFMTSQTSSLTGWKVVYVKSTFKVLILLVGILAFAVAVFIITSRVAATKAINKISHLFTPLESIANKVIRIAKGDLSVEFDEEKSSSEVEKLIDNLNETVESMRGYIGRISDIVESISDKDLTVSVDGDFQGNYVAIREGLEQILDSLNSSFEQINNESEIVFKYAHQLEKTTENVANSSIEQNDSVTTVVTEMDALNNQAKKINDSAMQVLDNADVTNRHMEDGTEKMADLVEAMNRIEDCYSKISDFVVEINSIAEETNLLSLNASIEAARAGEAGKGFAVVASEISSLAESSAKASENIRELIYVTSEAVAHGKKLVDTTSDSISQGKDDALKTKEYVNAIVEFVEKQKNAIEKIGNSLKTISVMVDNGAASAQENTVISQQLGESAKHLKETVGAFSLK